MIVTIAPTSETVIPESVRAMVTIERTARGTDADDERDISNLIAAAQS